MLFSLRLFDLLSPQRLEVRQMDSQSEAVAQEVKAALAQAYGDRLAALYVFGSRARGDHRPDSDLDLAIVLNGDRKDFITTKLDMADRAFDVLLETGILIQPLPLWKDGVTGAHSLGNPALLENISGEGIRLR